MKKTRKLRNLIQNIDQNVLDSFFPYVEFNRMNLNNTKETALLTGYR